MHEKKITSGENAEMKMRTWVLPPDGDKCTLIQFVPLPLSLQLPIAHKCKVSDLQDIRVPPTVFTTSLEKEEKNCPIRRLSQAVISGMVSLGKYFLGMGEDVLLFRGISVQSNNKLWLIALFLYLYLYLHLYFIFLPLRLCNSSLHHSILTHLHRLRMGRGWLRPQGHCPQGNKVSLWCFLIPHFQTTLLPQMWDKEKGIMLQKLSVLSLKLLPVQQKSLRMISTH